MPTAMFRPSSSSLITDRSCSSSKSGGKETGPDRIDKPTAQTSETSTKPQTRTNAVSLTSSKSSSTTSSSSSSRTTHSKAQVHNSRSSSKQAPPSAAAPPPPVNFQELMKIAERNSERQLSAPVRSGDVAREKDQSLAPPQVQRRAKSYSPTPPVGKMANKERQRHSPCPSASSRGSGGTSSITRERVGGPASSLNCSKGSSKSVAVRQGKETLPADRGGGRGRGRGLPGRGRGHIRHGHNDSKPVKADSFYGAASVQLAKDERPRFATRHLPAQPRNSLVSDYLQQLKERSLMEEEEEEDSDDYIVEEDEYLDDEEDGCDYSAAIREIFGYDKRRWVDSSLMDAQFML